MYEERLRDTDSPGDRGGGDPRNSRRHHRPRIGGGAEGRADGRRVVRRQLPGKLRRHLAEQPSGAPARLATPVPVPGRRLVRLADELPSPSGQAVQGLGRARPRQPPPVHRLPSAQREPQGHRDLEPHSPGVPDALLGRSMRALRDRATGLRGSHDHHSGHAAEPRSAVASTGASIPSGTSTPAGRWSRRPSGAATGSSSRRTTATAGRRPRFARSSSIAAASRSRGAAR